MTVLRSFETLGNNLATQRHGPWDVRSLWCVHTVLQSISTKPDGNWCHYWPYQGILGAFAKFRRAAVSYVMFVCLSVRVEQLGSQWTGFHEIWFFDIVSCVEKIPVSLKSYKSNWYFKWRPIHILTISYRILRRMRYASDKSCKKNRTRILYSIISSPAASENLRVCEIMWKNMIRVAEITDENVIQRMRFACWITKYADRH